jgi:hypothetical protein
MEQGRGTVQRCAEPGISWMPEPNQVRAPPGYGASVTEGRRAVGVGTILGRCLLASGLPVLDPVLVARTLSQLDFGVLKDWQETLERTSGREGGLGLSLWGAANIGGKGDSPISRLSEVAFEQTAESYASRLLVRLEEADQLVRLDSDASLDLRRGTVIAAEAELEGLDVFNEKPKPLFQPAWSEVWRILHELDTQKAEASVRIIRVGLFAAVATWPSENLRVSAAELTGEAEMVGIVRRTFTRESGETQTVTVVRPIALD